MQRVATIAMCFFTAWEEPPRWPGQANSKALSSFEMSALITCGMLRKLSLSIGPITIDTLTWRLQPSLGGDRLLSVSNTLDIVQWLHWFCWMDGTTLLGARQWLRYDCNAKEKEFSLEKVLHRTASPQLRINIWIGAWDNPPLDYLFVNDAPYRF